MVNKGIAISHDLTEDYIDDEDEFRRHRVAVLEPSSKWG
jgi:hypothetical protein